MRSLAFFFTGALLLLVTQRARAEVINVTPGDSFTKIEAAKAGDEVVIAPGTYNFRVHLTEKGTAAAPITIRAQDPTKPPVWDFGDTLVEEAPGSYDGGDRGRGCWQIDGAENVKISGIVFQHCRNASHNSAGIRYLGGAKALVVRDSVFRQNDNGLTGGSENSEMLVEHCEFDRNGNESADNPTHNVYIYGGTFSLRYSYVHDPVQGQNFHIRAHQSSLDYNWFARSKRYEGDLMSDDDEPAGPSTQEMLFRGNVVVQGNPNNKGQIIAVSNDNGLDQLTLKVRLIANTFVVGFAQSSVVHLDDSDGTKVAEISNNVFSGGKPLEIDNAGGSASGTNNWFVNGTDVGDLTGSVFGASAPFKDAAKMDFTLAPGSNAIGAASTSVLGLPDREYFQNETIINKYRVRASAKDIGAFESTTTGAGLGPYDAAPAGGPEAPGATPGSSSSSSSSGGAKAESASGGAADEGGCGCRAARATVLAPSGLVGVGIVALLARARRRRGSR
ncbi:MAG TPA: hypothetical protein VM925_23255 [Labilithrix sp.]|nr:hypothetical protein [Labilithrix sp.]